MMLDFLKGKFEPQYLKFHDSTSSENKTKVYQVYSQEDGKPCGVIKWSTHCRCYAFYPRKVPLLFTTHHLAEIIEFISLIKV